MEGDDLETKIINILIIFFMILTIIIIIGSDIGVNQTIKLDKMIQSFECDKEEVFINNCTELGFYYNYCYEKVLFLRKVKNCNTIYCKEITYKNGKGINK